MKSALILILVIAAVAVAGGGYYYFEIYVPQKYAEAILPFYQKLEGVGLEPDASSLKKAADYESALDVLNARIALLNSIEKDLVFIKTPKRMENYQKEFAGYVDFALAQNGHAKELAAFLKNANAFRAALTSLKEEKTPFLPTATVADFQKFFNKRLSEIQTAGRELFYDEVAVATNPSFSELKSLWDEVAPGFDLLLKKISSLNPKLAISQISNNLFTSSEQKRLDSSNKKTDELSQKLDDLSKRYTPYDILAFRHFPDASPAEFSERALRFYQAMKELQQKYGR